MYHPEEKGSSKGEYRKGNSFTKVSPEQTPCPRYPGFQTCLVGSRDGRCPGDWGQLNDEETLGCQLSLFYLEEGSCNTSVKEGIEFIDLEMTMRRKEGEMEREENGLTSKHFLTWGWTLSGSFVSLGREGGITQGGNDTRYLLPFYIYIENIKQILLSSLLDTNIVFHTSKSQEAHRLRERKIWGKKVLRPRNKRW